MGEQPVALSHHHLLQSCRHPAPAPAPLHLPLPLLSLPLPPLPPAIMCSLRRPQARASAPRQSGTRHDASPFDKTASIFEFSLCLSLACLGKIIIFICKWRKKTVFSQLGGVRLQLQHRQRIVRADLEACINSSRAATTAGLQDVVFALLEECPRARAH